MKRRQFFGVGAAALISAGLKKLPASLLQQFSVQKSGFWTDGYFQQKSVDLTNLHQGTIRAKVNGTWEQYHVRALNAEFFEWNIEDRLANIEKMRKGSMPDWSGAHNAAVATAGKNRGDSRFSLNNAIKGTGLCPKQEKIEDIIGLLKKTGSKDMEVKFNTLTGMYQDSQLWDLTKLISLELYSKPDFETHTFLNQMANPVSSIVYLDVPSFEIRAIARLLHPDDPGLGTDERNYLTYINTIHSYFHSHFTSVVPAVVYHVIEVFDNSPSGRKGQGKKGLRVV